MMAAQEAGQDRKAAFLQLFEKHAAALERLAAAYTATREDREDLVQEIAKALWQALPGYRGEASERTWLYRIAHNVAITATVKLRRRERREAAAEELLDAPSAARSAEQHLLAEEKRRLLLDAVRGLPAADRQITVLHLEGLSGAEIEEVTGLSEGAIATRLTRVREKLRRAIRAKESGDDR
jgi:RNA polymerase sigma-70 factor (ECF subfamily)